MDDVSYFTNVSHFLLYLGAIGLVSLLVAKAMGAAQVVVTGKVFFLILPEEKTARPIVRDMRHIPFLEYWVPQGASPVFSWFQG